MDTFEKIMHALGDAKLADFGNDKVVAAFPARLVEDVLNSVLQSESSTSKNVRLCPKCDGKGFVFSYICSDSNTTRICPTCKGAQIFIV